MKKRRSALVLTALMLLSGCGGIDDAKESTVTVNSKGIVTEALVEDFSSEAYEEKELEASVEKLVEAYNKEAGEKHVTLKKTEVKDGKATVQLQYKSDEDYRGFNRVDFFAGTVKEAQEEGYGFSGAFTDSKGKTAGSGTVPKQCQEEQVIIIREPLCVLVPGTILYVSKNMEILEEGRVRLTDDTGISYENAQVTTDAYGYVIYKAK